MSGLEGKVALVTGGTGGIGAAICLQLAAAGARIATNYRNQEKAEKWQREAKARGHDILVVQASVRDYDACASLLQKIQQHLGDPVSILVNNAGITRDTRLIKMSREQWEEVIDTNLTGPFNITQQVVGDMVNMGWGRIVNIASVNGQKGQFGQANYAASKAGMHGLTMSLAQELAKKGITVNTVSPGYISTEMVTAVPEAIRDKIIAEIPVGRLGTPEEVASMVGYLCSNSAGFITGADFSVNGGQHMM